MVEMLAALFVIALILGTLILGLSGIQAEEKLRAVTRDLEAMAKTARSTALRQQQPYEIAYVDRSFILRPATELPSGRDNRLFGPTDTDIRSNNPYGLLVDPGRGGDAGAYRTLDVPSEIRVKREIWGQEGWIDADESPWVFQPTGLSDPFRVTFIKDEDFVFQSFSPLTANVQDEEFHFE